MAWLAIGSERRVGRLWNFGHWLISRRGHPLPSATARRGSALALVPRVPHFTGSYSYCSMDHASCVKSSR